MPSLSLPVFTSIYLFLDTFSATPFILETAPRSVSERHSVYSVAQKDFSVKGLVNCKRRGEPEETAGAKLGRPIEGRFPFKNKRKDCGVLQIRLRQMKGKIGKRACTAARGRGLPLPKLTRFSQIKLNYTVILTHQDKVDRKLSPIKREQGECILIGYSWYFVILEKKCARHSAVPMFSSILCLVSRVLCFKNANGEQGKKWPRICSLRCKCQKTIVVCRP